MQVTIFKPSFCPTRFIDFVRSLILFPLILLAFSVVIIIGLNNIGLVYTAYYKVEIIIVFLILSSLSLAIYIHNKSESILLTKDSIVINSSEKTSFNTTSLTGIKLQQIYEEYSYRYILNFRSKNNSQISIDLRNWDYKSIKQVLNSISSRFPDIKIDERQDPLISIPQDIPTYYGFYKRIKKFIRF